MENNFKVTFWINKTKKNAKNLVPVYLRVWFDYAYFTKGTGIWVRFQDWDKKTMRLRGASQEVYTINAQLDATKVKVLQIINQLSLLGRPFNVNTIKKMLNGNESNQITLMKVCDEQISEMQKLKGKDFAPATIIKYKNTVLRLREFIRYKFKRADLYLYELNYYFISEFELFLKQK